MKDPFWKSGVRFQCQGSGRCCVSRGEYGYVYVTREDRKRLAKELKMSQLSFTRKYCRFDSDAREHYLLNESDDCLFLEGTKCGVYRARPVQCRTWPFWPENLENRKTWNREVVRFCPGVGKGKLYSEKEIQDLAEVSQ